MSETEYEIHPYQARMSNIFKMCKNELSESNYALIEKYDRQMVTDTLGHATRRKNLEVILSLSRLIKKDWNDVTHDDISKLVYDIMTKYSKNGQESHSTWDHKKILKIFFRWMKLGSRSYQDVGNPPETDKIKLKSVKNKIIREQLLTDDDLVLLLRSSRNTRDKAMISVAYESGCRPGELLSLKVKHVKIDQYGAMLSVDGKTGARNIRIVKSVPHLMQWIDAHPWKNKPESPLWPVFIFCSAKNEAKHEVWAEMKNRTLMLSPNTDVKKYVEANKLTGQKFGLPTWCKSLYENPEDRELSKDRINILKERLNGSLEIIKF